MAIADKYVPTEREKAFHSTIENQKYEREIINGLAPFLRDKAPADIVEKEREGFSIDTVFE